METSRWKKPLFVCSLTMLRSVHHNSIVRELRVWATSNSSCMGTCAHMAVPLPTVDWWGWWPPHANLGLKCQWPFLKTVTDTSSILFIFVSFVYNSYQLVCPSKSFSSFSLSSSCPIFILSSSSSIHNLLNFSSRRIEKNAAARQMITMMRYVVGKYESVRR